LLEVITETVGEHPGDIERLVRMITNFGAFNSVAAAAARIVEIIRSNPQIIEIITRMFE